MFVQKFYNVYAKVACYSLCVFICYAKIVVWFAEAHIHVHQINAMQNNSPIGLFITMLGLTECFFE